MLALSSEEYAKLDRSVSRTLISVDSFQETGHDVVLTKNQPRRVYMKRGGIMPLREERGMFILHLSILDAGESIESSWLLGFCTAEVVLPSGDLVSPRSDLTDKQLAGR